MNKSYIFFQFQNLIKNFNKFLDSIAFVFASIFVLTILLDVFVFPFIILFIRKRSALIVFLVAFISSLLFTNMWNNNFENEINSLNQLEQITGTVIEPPSQNSYSSNLIVDAYNINGNISVTTLNKNIKVGDKISFKNDLEKIEKSDPFEYYLFSKKVWYKTKNNNIEIISKNKNIFIKLNDWLTSNLNQLSPIAENLTSGILFGTKENLSKDEKDALNSTGTSHIISASGFNVLIIYILLNSITTRLNKKVSFFISILGCFIYVLTIGWHILPARRALFMLTGTQIGLFFGRKQSVLYFLILSAFIVSIVYPFYILNISFLLSFFSTLSLFLFTEKISYYLKNLPEIISSNLSATTAAIIGTAPISLLFFNSFSIIAPLSNVLVLPLTPLIMYLGMILIVFNTLGISLFVDFINFILEIIVSIFWDIVNSLSNFHVTNTSSIFLLLIISSILIVLLLKQDFRRYNEKYFIYKNAGNRVSSLN